MALKGMTMTLTIIVAAVVILVTALVILTIFGSGIANVSSLAEAKVHCQTVGQASCSITGSVPPTWMANTVKQGNVMKSCSEICTASTCTEDAADSTKFVMNCY